MRQHLRENLSHDAVHGYIPFSCGDSSETKEVFERQIIDHPWVQRMRHIHQLQTAWWVFPTAEHTRFAHVIGAMHLGSCTASVLYESLKENCPDTPSRGYIETLIRMAGLLHDVGHGPFGHFFDEHYLKQFGLTHETLGGTIICDELGDLLRGLRRNPNTQLDDGEQIDPHQIAWLITRPTPAQSNDQPPWLCFLRSLLSGIYTIDNMDFVLRDAYMSGYSQRAFDLDRLLRYTFFSEQGLTIHDRGIDALLRFISVRAELFRSIYFHRTVRAIDLTLQDLFAESKEYLFPGDPREHLEVYRDFTDSSLLVDVSRWGKSQNPKQVQLGQRWQQLLWRKIKWKMVCQRNLVFSEQDAVHEQSSIFSDRLLVEQKLRERLPSDLADMPLRVDIARHIHRPHTQGPSRGQNYWFDSARQMIRPLNANALYSRLPVSYRICRVYAQTDQSHQQLASALDQLIGGTVEDDLTNM